MILSELIRLCIATPRSKWSYLTGSTMLKLIRNKTIIYIGTIDVLIERNMDLFQKYCGSNVSSWNISYDNTQYTNIPDFNNVGIRLRGLLTVHVGKPVDFIDKWIDFLYDSDKCKQCKTQVTLWDWLKLVNNSKGTFITIRDREGIFIRRDRCDKLIKYLSDINNQTISNYDLICFMYVGKEPISRLTFQRLLGLNKDYYPSLTIHLDIEF